MQTYTHLNYIANHRHNTLQVLIYYFSFVKLHRVFDLDLIIREQNRQLNFVHTITQNSLSVTKHPRSTELVHRN